MEPSRDDFVIAIRSAFLKKGTKQRFSLLGLLFFSIILIVLSKFNFTAINYLKLGINEVVFRTSFIVSLPEKYISYSYHTIEEHIDLYKDYNLKKEELKKSDNFYEFEPEENEILNNLLPKNISTQIFKAFLENAASEQGSRMTAMDNATRNAGDLVDKLTITYNRSRQAAITKELIEIISGAESL